MTEEVIDPWTGLLARKSLPAQTRKRLHPDDFESVTKSQQGDYEDEGWEVDRVLKRSVKMRRAKPHDIAFEDRVWAAMAKLNFVDMNASRTFKLPYGKGAGEWQQIDVFAADEDVVLVIECKSTATTTTHAFKKEIEAIQGQRPGMIATIKKRYPGHKVKFILATNNYGLTQPTMERFDDADIVHMDEEAITYYLTLSDHLGQSARYQLLGNLFAGTKIPGLEPTVPAIQGKMGGHTYFSFAIEPDRLLKFAYILHRNKANNRLMPTYQRLIKKTRLQKVADFVDGGGFFPNSVIINIEESKRSIFERVKQPSGEAKLGMLKLPQVYRAAFVIDGQHRLYGYANSHRAATDQIPVVAFVGLPREEQVELFMQINENQKAVPKNLRNTLNADLLWSSTDLRQRARALRLRIAQHLGEQKTSPLYGRIIVGEDSRTPERCITIDAINNGLVRGNLLGSWTKNDVQKMGSLYRGTHEATYEHVSAFLERFFGYLRSEIAGQWEAGNGEGGLVFTNNGVEASLRLVSDVVDHLVDIEGVDVRAEDPASLMALCEYVLNPAVAYLASLDAETANGFRRQYGAGGAVRTWRLLQEVIRNSMSEFDPPGLTDYLEDQERQFNSGAQAIVSDLERFLSDDIRSILEGKFDTQWFKKGVPIGVRKDASELAIEKNEDRPESEELEPWDCLHLIDYFKIVTKDHGLWEELFEDRYVRPDEEKMPGGWKAKMGWMEELNRIRNTVFHDHIVSEADYEYLVALRDWLLPAT